MKKLMVAAIAAFVAVASQAAALNWSSGKALLDDGTGSGWGSATLPKSSSDYTMTVVLADSYVNGALGNIIGTDDVTGTGTKNTIGGSTTKTDGDFATSKKYYAQATIENTVTGAKLMSQILQFEWDGGSYNPKIDFMAQEGPQGIPAGTLVSMNGEFSSTTGYWAAEGWQSVPEPTSGLLLLIGVAGLALRRRRA